MFLFFLGRTRAFKAVLAKCQSERQAAVLSAGGTLQIDIMLL